ncbi:MAG: helix-turn-helix domain-containing protein [Saprospiraceae bacterium]|nr:helix-turn-helix domain-containing protein [Saprospiraceae bacterium]
MEEKLFVSLTLPELKGIIIDCVNACLRNNTKQSTYTPETTFQIVSKRDAAKYLGISQSMINKLMASGKLNYSKIGKKVVFDIEDLKKLIEH